MAARPHPLCTPRTDDARSTVAAAASDAGMHSSRYSKAGGRASSTVLNTGIRRRSLPPAMSSLTSPALSASALSRLFSLAACCCAVIPCVLPSLRRPSLPSALFVNLRWSILYTTFCAGALLSRRMRSITKRHTSGPSTEGSMRESVTAYKPSYTYLGGPPSGHLKARTTRTGVAVRQLSCRARLPFSHTWSLTCSLAFWPPCPVYVNVSPPSSSSL
mmetsp:Transcript_4390/g.14196  ORF Transcript_4390/g.14196 Transcript_4390/m.14196 type:complete len:217 (+) Transcript_4390:1849-2499(+)